ncbi:MAG: Fic family protein [Thermoleophilaceae bacterium]
MGRAQRGRYEERIWEPQPGGMGGRRNRQAFRYQAFVPRRIAGWDVTLRADAVAAVAEASAAVAHLNDSPPKLASSEALARQLLRAESLASSRIEGLELSHRRLARAAHGADRHDQKASDVVGNIAAMERAIDIGAEARPFTVTDIRDIHSTLMRFSFDRAIAGVVRTKQSWIGRNPYTPRDATFVPPPPERVEPLLEDLCRFMSREDPPALVQAAIAHAQFETIHPFADGNGRVGRCLIHSILMRRGLATHYVPPVSLILATRREQYVAGLVQYRDGEVDEWCELFCDATSYAARAAERLADEIAATQQQWIERLGRPRKDSSAYAIVAALPAHPVIDVPTAARLARVSDVAAGRVLNRMEQLDILQNIGERQRGRTWECRELFDLVSEIERDLATP